MAIKLTGQAGNIKDLLSNVDRNGNYYVVGQILDRETVFFRDAPMVEASNVTFHEFSVDNTLPSSSIRRANKRRTAAKGSTRLETVALEDRSIVYKVDVEDLKKAPNPQEFLNNEMRRAVQGISQDFDTQMLYGSGVADEMEGMAPKLDALGQFVVSGGGTTNLTSMYLAAWDAASGCSVAYPSGSGTAGVKMEDKGIVKSWTDDGFIEYATHEVSIAGGLVVKDDRAIGRIANIDVASPTSTTFSEDDMILLVAQFPAHLRNKIKAYASRNLKAAIDMRANVKDNAYYTPMTGVFGEAVNAIVGVPIMLDEMISENETQVV